MDKPAVSNHPVNALIEARWSPRAFAATPVADADLASLFEAARWAASCYNEQPWRFIVARREDNAAHDQLLRCLVPGNQAWATQAPVLVLGIARQKFAMNGKPNAHARHDLGLATAQLTLEATARKLFVHVMAGIEADRAREVYAIPADFDVVTAFAIGYAGNSDNLPENMRAAEQAPRERKPLADLVFADTWAAAADFTRA